MEIEKEHGPEHELQTLTTFLFSDSEASVDIKIQQVIEDDYGLFIWPSSKVIAEYLWDNRKSLIGKKILELGAGTGLPSLVCAACGAKVIASDREDSRRVLKNLENTILSNNPVHWVSGATKQPVFLDLKVMGLTWGMFGSSLLSMEPVDYIIGADLFYDNKKGTTSPDCFHIF